MKTEQKHNFGIENKIMQLLDCRNILILGPNKIGKTSVALSYAIHEISTSKSLFFTTQRKELIIDKAFRIFPEMQQIIKSRLLIYQAPITNSDQFGKVTDQMLSDIILGIIQIIEKNHPDKIVFDEITSLLAFSNLDLLKEIFRKLLNELEKRNITALFTVAEPVSQRSIEVISILKNEFAYYLNLKTNPIF